jgi:hypothetical protein
MAGGDKNHLLRAAIAAIRDCAAQIETHSGRLLKALPNEPIDGGLRATALELSAGLKDIAGRVSFELALLQTQLGEGNADAATVVQSLSSMDATMMDALAPVADVVDELESAAERDSRQEHAFVLMIEAMGVMLQNLEKARAATQALSAAMPGG